MSTLFANGHIIRYDPILEDLTSNFVVLYINVSLLIKLFIVCGAQHEYSCEKGLNNVYAHRAFQLGLTEVFTYVIFRFCEQ